MPHRSNVVLERRAVPRFKVSFAAEFAFGTVLVPVTVRDMSTMGCGVIISDAHPDLPDRIGGRGLLRLPQAGGSASGLIVPVVLRNTHRERGGLIYGLEFIPLPIPQGRKLAATLASLAAAG